MTSTFPAPAWWDPTRPVPDVRTELPGPRAREVLAADAAVTSPSLPRAYPLVPRRGHGAALEDMDGNLFLDFNAGIAVNSTGHAHPRVVAAVREQAEDLLHYSASDFYLPIYSQMCAALAEVAPMSGPTRVFLTNSGAEGVEGALKLARYATGPAVRDRLPRRVPRPDVRRGQPDRVEGQVPQGFRAAAARDLHAPYAFAQRDPETGARSHDPEQTFDYLENVLFRHQVSPTEVAAVFVEPIQGEGGYIVPPVEWLVRLRELCDRHGILLVADEVQSGMGRTGRMWAIEHAGVEPDVLITAKGLASGLPLGGFVARAELMETWGAGAHGSTYGGSPVPCAAGLATLETIRAEGLLAHATEVGDFLLSRLAELPGRFPGLVTDVRGIGLMIGVEFRTGEQAEAAQQGSFERGLLVLECGETTVRMSPPLVVSLDQAKTALDIFGAVLAELAG